MPAMSLVQMYEPFCASCDQDQRGKAMEKNQQGQQRGLGVSLTCVDGKRVDWQSQ